MIKIDLSSSITKSRINIAPNPVKDVIKLNIFSKSTGKMQLVLSDNVGKTMRLITTSVEKGSNTISTANLENWPAGIYTLKVILGGEVFIKRVVINK